jgi:hypothetical protein
MGKLEMLFLDRERPSHHTQTKQQEKFIPLKLNLADPGGRAV